MRPFLCETDSIHYSYFVLSYRKEDIIEHFTSEFYKEYANVQFIEQKSITGGTADALRCAKPLIRNKFILIYGDVIPTAHDIQGLSMMAKYGYHIMGTREVEDAR